MLPSLVSKELVNGVRRFLQTTFPSTTPLFLRDTQQSAIDDFVAASDTLFKGPYLSLGLPFRKLESDAELPLKHFHPGFPPYLHQLLAFGRLCAHQPLSTLVATGTGSGKTECFMYPILDHCAGEMKPGIKAIIIYPMNALASDQARRFAREIHTRPELRGRVRVGLFVGDNDASPDTTMSDDFVITCKETQRDNPPDILLTNYKMLDYLLIRPKDHRIWRHNDPDILRYLVVDELHTFDGAQGTDLACLIRRLRHRLECGDGLACVGTSATIGGEGSIANLRQYAHQVFSAEFDEQSVILEDRLSPEEFLPDQTPETRWPDPDRIIHMGPDRYGAIDDYVAAHAQLWFERPPQGLASSNATQREQASVELGELLCQHGAFHQLLRACRKLIDLRTLRADWQAKLRLSQPAAEALLDSLLAMVATAKSWRQPHLPNPKTGGVAPLVQLRSQLWLRELRRLVSSVEDTPLLRLADDLPHEPDHIHLPVAHCRECHLTGWASVKPPHQAELSRELREIYTAYFGKNPDTTILVPHPVGDAPGKGLIRNLCSHCGFLASDSASKCPGCKAEASELYRVWVPETSHEHQQNGSKVYRYHNDCPSCGANQGLMLMGARAANLSSVLIGNLYSSLYNDDHKLIAFSDSVQDAAHRAGFFGARTWRQVVRQSLHQALTKRMQGMPLMMVAESFGDYWHEQLGDKDFTATFIAPDVQWLRDWEHLQAHDELPAGSDLISKWIKPRLQWEVLSEFGLGSRIGRTLERTGLAAVGPDLQRLERAVQLALAHLQEEIAEFRTLSEQDLRRFMIGLLWRLKVKGAFFSPALASYLKEGGNTFQINRLLYLPGYGRKAQPPAFLSVDPVSKNFETIHSATNNWYRHWFNKTLGDKDVMATASMVHAYRLVLTALTGSGLLLEHEVRGEKVWSLDANQWSCSTQVAEFSCSECRHRVQMPFDQVNVWQEMACQRGICGGHYRELKVLPTVNPAPKPPVRLITSEHTGLLPPDMRLDIENSFKAGKHLWDINLLSATPTMEMGIDIGDLSSVLLCSVPPSQANYLQRIGRAGRKDGNALTVTVANGVPHDLYFYADPMEMMAGTVATPGVYLNASAVLERQLIAFCFDQWVCTGIDESVIPGSLKNLLDGLEVGKTELFPNNLITYIEGERSRLYREFLNLFPELKKDDACREQIEQFLFSTQESGDISYRLLNRLHELVKQRASLLGRIRDLKKSLDQQKKLPQDEATTELITEIISERVGLIELVKSINAKQTLNFFTDEGLLPNYAFPEEGVKLHSLIYRRVEKKDKGPGDASETDEHHNQYEKKIFEFTRPSAAALSELVPENHFYGGGHQVEIDQIDLNVSSAEEWRLCNRCHYTESLVGGDHHQECPRCGSSMWRNSSQKQTLLKLKQVFANSNDRESRIADDSEQRDPIFFNRQLLVDVPHGVSQKAYRLQDERLPFGFEYLKNACFREINFGRFGDDGLEFEVAGTQAKRTGFKICRHCGKVQRRRKDPRLNHAITCRMRKVGVEPAESDFHNALYLYRELNSEAVRLLLPIAEVSSSDIRMQSLVAALHLGLKAYFGGNVAHLQITNYSEPVGDSSLRRHYLVILDTVPGGTGYLKQLMLSPEQLVGMLRASYEALQSCSCNEDPDKDGCYQCLYAYRESRNLELTSRRAAVDLIGRVLELSDQLETVSGLDQINLNVLYESELEKRFIQTLANAAANIQLTETSVNGKPGFMLSIVPEGSRVMAWRIEPQVTLGPADGVALNTRPDFVLWPVAEREGVLPVAVFLDGYAYHKNKVRDDTQKRIAIWASGQFKVWSLNWDDLPKPGYAETHPEVSHFLNPLDETGFAVWNQIASRGHWDLYQAYSEVVRKGSFAWLIEYLSAAAPRLEGLRNAALSRAISTLNIAGMKSPESNVGLIDSAYQLSPSSWHHSHHDGALLGMRTFETVPDLTVVASVPMSSLASATALTQSSAMLIYLDDTKISLEGYEASWRIFWAASNLFQFLPYFIPVSASGLQSGGYESLVQPVQPSFVPESEAETNADQDEGFAELLEITSYPEELESLLSAGASIPSVGEDWAQTDGEVIGELEWCWSELKCALIEHQHDLANILRSQGWFVIETIGELEVLSARLEELTRSVNG